MGWTREDNNGWDGSGPDAADLAREERIKAATPPQHAIDRVRSQAREDWQQAFDAAHAAWPFKPHEMLWEGKMPIKDKPNSPPYKYVWWRVLAQAPGHFAVRVITSKRVEEARLWAAPKTTPAEAAEFIFSTAKAWPLAIWAEHTSPDDDALIRPTTANARQLVNDVGVWSVPKDLPHALECWQVEFQAMRAIFGRPDLWG